MTLSSYFIGISAGQLLYGPLLDRFEENHYLLDCWSIFWRLWVCTFVSDIDTLLVCLYKVGSQLSCYRHGSGFAKIPKVLSLLMLVVGFSNAPYYWRLCNSGLWWHVVFLIFGYWYCGSIGLSFWFATYARTRYFDFVKTKTNYS
jgi:DHA1 family bicyclomycin/chloramphenicol resistance-like MFS transporter